MQFFHQLRGPGVQLVRVGVLERVLILGATDAILDRQILHRLQVEGDALYLFEFGLQPAHQIGGGNFPFLQRLQIDQHAPAVESGVDAIHADE